METSSSAHQAYQSSATDTTSSPLCDSDDNIVITGSIKLPPHSVRPLFPTGARTCFFELRKHNVAVSPEWKHKPAKNTKRTRHLSYKAAALKRQAPRPSAKVRDRQIRALEVVTDPPTVEIDRARLA